MADAPSAAPETAPTDSDTKLLARKGEEEPEDASPKKLYGRLRILLRDKCSARVAQPADDAPKQADVPLSCVDAVPAPEVQAETAAPTLSEIISQKVMELDAERLVPALSLLRQSQAVAHDASGDSITKAGETQGSPGTPTKCTVRCMQVY